MAALASERESVNSVFDYVLFPESYLDQVGMSSEQTKGKTPDDTVNEELHVDASHVEAKPLADLVTLVHGDYHNPADLPRYTPGKIKSLVNRFLESGDLDEARVSPGVLEKVRQ